MNIIRFISMSMVLFAAIQFSTAQNIEYSYDNAGNRILRQLVIGGNTAAPSIFDEPTKKLAAGVEVKDPFLDKVNELQVKIYPNPTRGQLVVELLNPDVTVKTQIVLYDLQGKVVLITQNPGDFTNIDISNHAAGVYIMKITSGTQSINWRIVKQ